MNSATASLAPGGHFLATVPIGYNPHLDNYLKEDRWGFSETYYMKRTDAWGTWRQVSREEAMTSEFGRPFACANAIAVGMTRVALNPQSDRAA